MGFDGLKSGMRRSRSPSPFQCRKRRKPSEDFTTLLQDQAAAAKAKHHVGILAKFGLFTTSAKQAQQTAHASLNDDADDREPIDSAPAPPPKPAARPTHIPLIRSTSRSLAPSITNHDPYSERVADWNLRQSERLRNSSSKPCSSAPLREGAERLSSSEHLSAAFPLPPHSGNTPSMRLARSASDSRQSRPRLPVPETKPPIPRRNSKRLQVKTQATEVPRYSLRHALGLTAHPLNSGRHVAASARRDYQDSAVELPLRGDDNFITPSSLSADQPHELEGSRPEVAHIISPPATPRAQPLSAPARRPCGPGKSAQESSHQHDFYPATPIIDFDLYPLHRKAKTSGSKRGTNTRTARSDSISSMSSSMSNSSNNSSRTAYNLASPSGNNHYYHNHHHEQNRLSALYALQPARPAAETALQRKFQWLPLPPPPLSPPLAPLPAPPVASKPLPAHGKHAAPRSLFLPALSFDEHDDLLPLDLLPACIGALRLGA